MLKVILADNLRLNRAGLRALLEGLGTIEVLGEASHAYEAVRLALDLKPDMLLLSDSMPAVDGVSAVQKVCADLPGIPVIVLSPYGDSMRIKDAEHAGACGYVSQRAAFSDLLATVANVRVGRRSFAPPRVPPPLNGSPRRLGRNRDGSELGRLSRREREVLQLVAEGRSTSGIAGMLQISKRTVDVHRHNITEKLGIGSIANLTRFAVRHGLCPV